MRRDGTLPKNTRWKAKVFEVKIRLAEPLHRQLVSEASRNGRTLTAEIRARLEASCAVDHARIVDRLSAVEARLDAIETEGRER
jgi:hypothetical protein